jgi:hypothetical protein
MDITKTVCVMKRSEFGYTAHANYIPFEMTEDDTGAITRTLVMARRDVNDLGWPEEITVTIVPGDTLNKEK